MESGLYNVVVALLNRKTKSVELTIHPKNMECCELGLLVSTSTNLRQNVVVVSRVAWGWLIECLLVGYIELVQVLHWN